MGTNGAALLGSFNIFKVNIMVNINELTIAQTKDLVARLSGAGLLPSARVAPGIDAFADGLVVIIRTFSAGVWVGTLTKKSGDEVILTDARRMYQWWCAESITLSAVAMYGINQSKSRIAGPVPSVWLTAIEILPFGSTEAERSVMDAVIALAQ